MDWEVMNTIFAVVLTIFAGIFAYMSSVIVSEQKKRRPYDKYDVKYSDKDNT
tara:strand:+ start:2055 stop:2210 length:156 start_codon:yes stop_codon:yes gene_type:complete